VWVAVKQVSCSMKVLVTQLSQELITVANSNCITNPFFTSHVLLSYWWRPCRGRAVPEGCQVLGGPPAAPELYSNLSTACSEVHSICACVFKFFSVPLCGATVEYWVFTSYGRHNATIKVRFVI